MKTFRRCVEITRSIRNNPESLINLRSVTPTEAFNITAMIHSDALFKFFDTVKDMDIKELYCALKLIEAQEAYDESQEVL